MTCTTCGSPMKRIRIMELAKKHKDYIWSMLCTLDATHSLSDKTLKEIGEYRFANVR